MFDHHSVATLENACLCEARLEIQQILVGVVWTFGHLVGHGTSRTEKF